MNDPLLERWQAALRAGESCVLVTVAATRGSVPRAAGAKMLVLADGNALGTVGGGKFEALCLAEAAQALGTELPRLQTYPLHEEDPCSFGAICGGEVTVLFEPLGPKERLVLVGGGHCAQAIARLALECGWHVTVLEDRAELGAAFPPSARLVSAPAPPEYISQHPWRPREALVMVSRNYHIDRAALAAALRQPALAYIGMIGSRRKVRHVFAQLQAENIATAEELARVYAPIGLDLGADSPAEIAISVLAEILQVLRGAAGGSLARKSEPAR